MDYLASMNLKHAAVTVAVLIAAFLSVGTRPDVSDGDRREVLHLLEFLRSGNCAMERNGKSYNSEDAYLHVKKKYDYFREKIKTTEDFIDYSASKSTMSGKFYLVFCDNEPAIRTRDWLLEELRKYRARVVGAYVFGHEVRSFQPCGSPKIYWAKPVTPELSARLREYHRELGAPPYGRIYAVVSGRPSDEKTVGFAEPYDGYFEISEVLRVARQIPPDCAID